MRKLLNVPITFRITLEEKIVTKVVVKKEYPIAEVVLNAPEVMNAKSLEMQRDIFEAFYNLAAEPEVKVIIITGAGTKAFCVGAEIREISSGREEARRRVKDDFRLYALLNSLNKPIIAVVHGYALGAGFDLVLNSDIVVASDNSFFGYPECNLGLIPAYGLLRLPEIIGSFRAKELMMTGRMLNATEAMAWGLVNKVVPENKMHDEARSVALLLSQKGPLALKVMKQGISWWLEEDGANNTIDAMADLFATEDFIEGKSSFLEKRKAQFKGR